MTPDDGSADRGGGLWVPLMHGHFSIVSTAVPRRKEGAMGAR